MLNDEDSPVVIVSAWLPHSRFRGEEQPVGASLQPGVATMLQTDVKWDGKDVENAFLILRLSDRRMFARLRVSGAGAAVEAVTYTGEA